MRGVCERVGFFRLPSLFHSAAPRPRDPFRVAAAWRAAKRPVKHRAMGRGLQQIGDRPWVAPERLERVRLRRWRDPLAETGREFDVQNSTAASIALRPGVHADFE